MGKRAVYVWGLTGGIACGKTTVAGWLREMGAPVVDADEISRRLTAIGGLALPAIRSAFGDDVFLKDGSLCRSVLAEQVFADEVQRERLNAILHPMIESDIRKQIKVCNKKGERIVILDVPLLYEAGMEDMADWVLCVSASRETQIKRLMMRDGLNRKQALQRIQSQWPLQEKERRADAVIYTDRIEMDPRAQVQQLYRQFWEGSQS